MEEETRGLDEIVRRIVQVAQPDRIILFGSAARGEMGSHSDVDLLVVKSGVVHRGRLIEDIYMNLLLATMARPRWDDTTPIQEVAKCQLL